MSKKNRTVQPKHFSRRVHTPYFAAIFSTDLWMNKEMTSKIPPLSFIGTCISAKAGFSKKMIVITLLLFSGECRRIGKEFSLWSHLLQENVFLEDRCPIEIYLAVFSWYEKEFYFLPRPGILQNAKIEPKKLRKARAFCLKIFLVTLSLITNISNLP